MPKQYKDSANLVSTQQVVVHALRLAAVARSSGSEPDICDGKAKLTAKFWRKWVTYQGGKTLKAVKLAAHVPSDPSCCEEGNPRGVDVSPKDFAILGIPRQAVPEKNCNICNPKFLIQHQVR